MRPAGPASGLAWAAAVTAMLVLPAAAGLRAGRRYGRENGQDSRDLAQQGLAAGFLTSVIATLMVTALATVVTALTARTGWMLHWMYPGQPLTPARAGHYALMASLGTDAYGVILAFVPGLGLLLGMLAASAAPLAGGRQTGGRQSRGRQSRGRQSGGSQTGGPQLAGDGADGP